jgi:hypothetical protein
MARGMVIPMTFDQVVSNAIHTTHSLVDLHMLLEGILRSVWFRFDRYYKVRLLLTT